MTGKWASEQEREKERGIEGKKEKEREYSYAQAPVSVLVVRITCGVSMVTAVDNRGCGERLDLSLGHLLTLTVSKSVTQGQRSLFKCAAPKFGSR